jgi:hypothetical protein
MAETPEKEILPLSEESSLGDVFSGDFPKWAEDYEPYTWTDNGETVGEVGEGVWNGMTNAVSGVMDGVRTYVNDVYGIDKILPQGFLNEPFVSNTFNLTYEHSDLFLPGALSVITSSVRKAIKNIDGGESLLKNLLWNAPVGALKGVHHATMPMWDYHEGDGGWKLTFEASKQIGGGTAMLASILSGAGLAGISAMATVKKAGRFMSDLRHREDRGWGTVSANVGAFWEDYRPVSYEEKTNNQIRSIQEEYIKSEKKLLKESKKFTEKELERRKKVVKNYESTYTSEVLYLKNATKDLKAKNEEKEEKWMGVGKRPKLSAFESNTYKRRFRAIEENWPGIKEQASYLFSCINGTSSPQREMSDIFSVIYLVELDLLTGNPRRENITSKFKGVHDEFRNFVNMSGTPMVKAMQRTAQKIVDLNITDETEEFTKEKAFQFVRLLYQFLYKDVPHYMEGMSIQH